VVVVFGAAQRSKREVAKRKTKKKTKKEKTSA
jgi:hypothetical protein